ncbi:MAG: hypothetical protein ACO1OB_18455 [Archangium sp.]
MRSAFVVLLVASAASAQVVKSSAMVTVGGCGSGTATSAVDVYRPSSPAASMPLFAFGHGFQNDKANAETLARALAAEGVVVVVPQFPSLLSACGSDHARNGRVLLAAIDQQIALGDIDASRVAVGGHSAGGLAALLAGASRPMVAQMLFDPVDNSGLGAAALANVRGATLLVFAPPAQCNSQGNAVAWFGGLTGPRGTLEVVNANHCDPQGPISMLCTFGCGGAAATSAVRSALFQKYAVTFLLRHLAGRMSPCVDDVIGADQTAGLVTDVDLRFGGCGGADAGVVVDAGVTSDAGVEVDAGVSSDAGVEVDAGVAVDAGVSVDAGVTNDAGVEVDAGVMVDAGMTNGPDGGMTEVPPPAGCGCSGSPLLALLGAVFLLLRRRLA